jgi:hypothetical protein
MRIGGYPVWIDRIDGIMQEQTLSTFKKTGVKV